MEQYNVTGMSCAACVARVEKAVNSVDGVTSCSVSLLTNSMGVEGSASESDIIKAVTDAGYGASLKDGKATTDASDLTDTQTPKIRNRLIASIVFLLPLMYLSMGHTMWGFPIPLFLEDYLLDAITQMMLALIIMIINRNFFVKRHVIMFNNSHLSGFL